MPGAFATTSTASARASSRGRPTDCSPPFMPLGASLRFRPATALLGRALSSTSSSLAGSPAAASARRAAATSSSSSSLQPTCAATPWGPGASAASHRRSPACSAGAAGMSSSSASAAAGAAAEAASLAAPAFSPPGSEILDGAEAAAGEGGPALATLETLKFDNTFTAELPGDSSESNVPRQVSGALYSWVPPTRTGTEPTTIAASADVARLVGLEPGETRRPEFALIFSGNAPLPQTRSYSQCYGGHQFGHWAGQLGDGRAICLGQALNAKGERWELQLKGAGRTPYSRMADGRAVLRSSIREYIASEAMHAMGVPTTRALSLVATGDQVIRDMFYNGNAQYEPGAVVCRVSKSFVRFGTFQLPVTRGADEIGLVPLLADYVIRHHYSHLEEGSANKYAAFLREVAQRTGRLVAEWHRVGFVHGVLNTDNMSILGETIDYGPYGFLERFDPDFTPNTTDLPGRRYCFRDQPEIGQWNVLQLARALVLANLVSQEETAEALQAYATTLTEGYESGMAAKLGLKEYSSEAAAGLLGLMYEDSADYTNTFRSLSSISATADSDVGGVDEASGLPAELAAVLGPLEEERYAAWRDWVALYRRRLQKQGLPEEERIALQNAANPAVVPRNHVMVGIISEAEIGNYAPLHSYMAALLKPYSGEGLDPAWLEPAPKKCRLGVELLSCSS
ncbi:hypothetical protein ABPG77_010040 [Micractinium sp. CCAP 211/92]